MLLNLVSAHASKDHISQCARTQFNGFLDSACTITCVTKFPKAYGLFLPQSVSTISHHRQVACMFFRQSFALLCFESILQKSILLNKHVMKTFPQTPQFFNNTVIGLVNHLIIRFFLKSPGDL